MVKKLAPYFPLIFIPFFYLVVIAIYSDFIPLWDGWETLELWLLKAVSSPFHLINFDNGGHPSMAYFLILGLGQYLDFGNMKLLFFTNAFLYVLAIFAFYGILKKIFNEIGAKKDIFFLTFLFAFYPITLAQTFGPMPDFGVFVFYIYFLYFLISKHRLMATLVGIGLIFSKEYGLLLYLFTLFCDFGFKIFQKQITFRHLTSTIKNKLIFIFPLILFAFRMIVITFYFRGRGVWQSVDLSNPVLYDKSFSPEVLSRIPWSYFSVIFVINFNWILSLFIFLGAIYFIWNRVKVVTPILFIYCLFIGSVFILTLFKTFTNPRYFMALYPLMIILFYFGLVSLIKKNFIRKITLFIIMILFFLTNFFTIDPVSKAIYGTFRFGKHEMLKMTSLSGECCGHGRDQLAYNLEYTQFDFLSNKIFQYIKPTEQTTIVYHPLEGLYMASRLNKNSYRRTMKLENVIKPFLTGEYGYMPDTYYPKKIIFTFDAIASKPRKIFYIEYPNMDNSDALEMFEKYYQTSEIQKYENLGYELVVRTMTLKGEL